MHRGRPLPWSWREASSCRTQAALSWSLVHCAWTRSSCSRTRDSRQSGGGYGEAPLCLRLTPKVGHTAAQGAPHCPPHSPCTLQASGLCRLRKKPGLCRCCPVRPRLTCVGSEPASCHVPADPLLEGPGHPGAAQTPGAAAAGSGPPTRPPGDAETGVMPGGWGSAPSHPLPTQWPPAQPAI